MLVVVTDEDTDATASRRASLDRQCIEAGIERRRADDPVIIAIPRRNIETWLWHLQTGKAVDEMHDYKPRFRDLKTARLHDLADELYRMCDRMQRLLPTAPPSLREACREHPNLTRFLR